RKFPGTQQIILSWLPRTQSPVVVISGGSLVVRGAPIPVHSLTVPRTPSTDPAKVGRPIGSAVVRQRVSICRRMFAGAASGCRWSPHLTVNKGDNGTGLRFRADCHRYQGCALALLTVGFRSWAIFK